jgi:hypothetical protein
MATGSGSTQLLLQVAIKETGLIVGIPPTEKITLSKKSVMPSHTAD